GLWTAYYLKHARPDLEVVLLEREFAGFGASGRNGGWLSSHIAASRPATAAAHGRDAVLALQRAMHETVDEVISVCAAESIDADVVKHGLLLVARSPAQATRLAAALAEDRSWELGPDDIAELDTQALAERVRIEGAVAGTWERQAARVQPAKLV